LRRRTPSEHLVDVVSYGQSSNDMPTNKSQSCRHLGETTESVGSFLAQSQPYKETLEHSAYLRTIVCTDEHGTFRRLEIALSLKVGLEIRPQVHLN
jgi:hypothetical protein